MTVPDFVRVVALFEAVVSGVLASLSLWYFTRRKPAKALVSHVARVTVTYFGFIAFGVVEITTHFGDEFRWELFAEMAIFALAAFAHEPLVRYEREAARQSRLIYNRRSTD